MRLILVITLIFFAVSCASIQSSEEQKLFSEDALNDKASEVVNITSKEEPTMSNDDAIWESIERCKKRNLSDWSDTISNFECISRITDIAEGLLKMGDSPTALKVIKFGMLYYPWDGRIQNVYKKSLEVFRSVTVQMLIEPEVNCKVALERLNLLKSVSPDMSIDQKACKNIGEDLPLLRGSIDDIIDSFKKYNVSELDEGLERSVYEDVSSMLKYQVAINSEDNFDYMIAKTINIWRGLTLYSTKMELAKNTTSKSSFDLHVNFVFDFRKKESESVCLEFVKRFTFENGNPVECLKQRKYDYENESLMMHLGTRDFKTLSDSQVSNHLKGPFPTLFIFRLDVKRANVTDSYYYMFRGDNRTYLPDSLALTSEASAYFPTIHAQNENTPGMEVLRFEETKNGDVSFTLKGLKESMFGDARSMELTFDPMSTYRFYKRMHVTGKKAEEVWQSFEADIKDR